MKVISGTAKGKVLKTLEGLTTRPTIARVKEGIFSSIQFLVPGARVLDLYAGSGQMGIEALSRNATFAAFVDESKEAIDVIKDNIAHCDVEEKSKVYNLSADEFLRVNKQKFDIIFLDPPYSESKLDEILPKIFNLLNEGGIIIAESESTWSLKEEIKGLELNKEYKYSKVKVTKFVKE